MTKKSRESPVAGMWSAQRGEVYGGALPFPLLPHRESFFFNFQVKNAGFYAILLRKTMLAARNWDRSVA